MKRSPYSANFNLTLNQKINESGSSSSSSLSSRESISSREASNKEIELLDEITTDNQGKSGKSDSNNGDF